MAKGDTLVWIILGLLAVFFFFPGVFSGFGLGKGTTTTTGVTAGTCFDDTLSFVSDDVRKDQLGQNPGQSYRLFVGAAKTSDIASFPSGFIDKGSNTDAATVTVPTEVPYFELAGWNANTESLVYRQKLTGDTDCTDPLTVQPVLAIGDLNVTNYNTDEDGSLNGVSYGTGSFNITSGQDFSFTPTFYTGSDLYWSNPYTTAKGVLVIQYNNTGLYTDIKIPSLVSAPVPDIARNNGSGWTRKAYYLGNMIPGQKLTPKVDVDVTSGKQPTGAITATAHNAAHIYLELYDASYDLRADNNNLIEGVQDELNVNIGMSDAQNRFSERIGGL